VTHPKPSARKRAEARSDDRAAERSPGALGDARQAKHLPPVAAVASPASPTAPAANLWTPGAPGERSAAPSFDGQYRIDIPKAGFEGPLDLLLHLIQQHELDILDIPVGFITERFLAYLKIMRTLTIDVASEYLVMAATLAHIKSKMLLPSVPSGQEDDGLPGDEDEDPRAELVRRLLEYQKYKAAGAELFERGTLGRDVFARGSAEPVPEGPAPFAPMGVFSLLDAFEKILKRTNVRLDHEVIFDRISITDRIMELSEKLEGRKAMSFEEMILEPGRAATRFDIVITFLAILEMAKLRMIRVYQTDPMAPIHVELSVQAEGQEKENAAYSFASKGENEVAPPAPDAAVDEDEEEDADDEDDDEDDADEEDADDDEDTP
jgi:segregation and condensation protein A